LKFAVGFAVRGSRFAVVLLLLGMACRREQPPATGVILSYEERPAMCVTCPRFRVEFRETGIVTFYGLAGCALPGERSYRIPAEDFLALERAFQERKFLTLPRVLPVRVTDVTRVTLAYRDDRRVHETVRLGSQEPALASLADLMRRAARADDLLKPSLAKYQALAQTPSNWDVNALGEDHENALTAAIWSGDLASARFLLSQGSIVTDGALGAAASREEPEFARLLLATLDERRRRHLGPMLLRAARSGDAVTREVAAAGADVNWRDPSDGRTPLLTAIQSDGLDRAAFLLARGASPSMADHDGRTPMHAAASASNTGFITMLSGRGANVNAQDREGRTPLMVAADRCTEWNVPALLAAGARVDLADRRGRTALRPQLSVTGDPKCDRTQNLIRHSRGRSNIR
jgi:ankyrin repeat protein